MVKIVVTAGIRRAFIRLELGSGLKTTNRRVEHRSQAHRKVAEELDMDLKSFNYVSFS